MKNTRITFRATVYVQIQMCYSERWKFRHHFCESPHLLARWLYHHLHSCSKAIISKSDSIGWLIVYLTTWPPVHDNAARQHQSVSITLTSSCPQAVRHGFCAPIGKLNSPVFWYQPVYSAAYYVAAWLEHSNINFTRSSSRAYKIQAGSRVHGSVGQQSSQHSTRHNDETYTALTCR